MYNHEKKKFQFTFDIFINVPRWKLQPIQNHNNWINFSIESALYKTIIEQFHFSSRRNKYEITFYNGVVRNTREKKIEKKVLQTRWPFYIEMFCWTDVLRWLFGKRAIWREIATLKTKRPTSAVWNILAHARPILLVYPTLPIIWQNRSSAAILQRHLYRHRWVLFGPLPFSSPDQTARSLDYSELHRSGPLRKINTKLYSWAKLHSE